MHNKNVLIITASIGSGHNKAAEAISNEMKAKYPAASIHTVDFMSTKTAYLNGLLKEIYLKMLDFIPNLYEFLYNFTAGRLPGFSVQSLLAMAMKRNMEGLIRQYEADIVICTHPFPCAAASSLKKSGRLEALLVGVITDFSVHQMWVYENIELYFVAHQAMREDLIRRGIVAERIRVTGIPIARVFNSEYNRQALLAKFNLEPDLPVILIMGGGLGLGGVKFALHQLEDLSMPLQILVVTGTNAALWSEINEYAAGSKQRVEVWGYSNNVEELMAVATCLISKPGALTICEALAMELPMLLHEPIPGPETENAVYVAGNGAAVWIQDNEKLGVTLGQLLSRPAELANMRRQAGMCKRPQAAGDIVDAIAAYAKA